MSRPVQLIVPTAKLRADLAEAKRRRADLFDVLMRIEAVIAQVEDELETRARNRPVIHDQPGRD